MGESVTRRDANMLWGKSGYRCAMPECRKVLIEEKTEKDSRSVIGQIAHIKGAKPGSARFDSTMTDSQRNCYENLILLCANHHKIIDDQPNSFPVETLCKIKRDHEDWVSNSLKADVLNVTFQELNIVTNFLTSNPIKPENVYTLIPYKEKIKKNSLSPAVEAEIGQGLVLAKSVEQFIEQYPDINFGERLKQGFVEEYNRLKTEGLVADELFYALRVFSSQKSKNFKLMAAGLTVLVYLFGKCEVFEK